MAALSVNELTSTIIIFLRVTCACQSVTDTYVCICVCIYVHIYTYYMNEPVFSHGYKIKTTGTRVVEGKPFNSKRPFSLCELAESKSEILRDITYFRIPHDPEQNRYIGVTSCQPPNLAAGNS